MAIVRIPEHQHTIRGRREIADQLRVLGIDYEIWQPSHPTRSDAPSEEILDA